MRRSRFLVSLAEGLSSCASSCASSCSLSCALCLICAACHRDGPEHDVPIAVPVRCAPAKREAVAVTRTLRGRLAAPPGGDLPVASQVPGRVLEVFVHEGDRVSAAAIVATIDDSTTRDALRQADATVVQAKSAAANAEATLDRTRQLVARGIAAKQELDDTLARADQARAAVSGAVAAADLARRTLGRVQVRSSFEGIVTRVWRGPGALVDGTAATPIVQLTASTLVELDADATERQLVDLAPGQTASVALATAGAPLPGTVRSRATALDPATGLGLVRIAVAATAPVVLGVFGTATVNVGERTGVLVVPAAAMRGAVADGAQVVVCDDAPAGGGDAAPGAPANPAGPRAGKAALRSVRIGWRDNERVEVVGGLAEGERVAVDHVLGLETGTPIVEEP